MPDELSAKPSRQDVHDAFGVLYQQLTDGYWVATTIEDKDRIRGIADAVFDILTQLNRADIESRTADFKDLTKKVVDANTRLDKLKQDIEKIIHVFKIATDLTKAIDKALQQASKFFPR